MTFEQAAARQYRRNSYYTVELIRPGHAPEQLGYTSRKSGTGLLAFIRSNGRGQRLLAMPGFPADGRFHKGKDFLDFGSGWQVRFGGTIRQEAQR